MAKTVLVDLEKESGGSGGGGGHGSSRERVSMQRLHRTLCVEGARGEGEGVLLRSYHHLREDTPTATTPHSP